MDGANYGEGDGAEHLSQDHREALQKARRELERSLRLSRLDPQPYFLSLKNLCGRALPAWDRLGSTFCLKRRLRAS